MAWKVIYCEHGEDYIGQKDKWRQLGKDHPTREEAVAALEADIETYMSQFADDEGVDCVEVDGWKATAVGMLDAWCEWDVIEG